MNPKISGLPYRAKAVGLVLLVIGSVGVKGVLAAPSCDGRGGDPESEYQRDIDRLMAPLFAVLADPSLVLSARARLGGPATRVCQQEVRDYVRDRLHGRIMGLQMKFIRPDSGGGSTWIEVTLSQPCEGQVLFKLLGNQFECTEQGYYGTIPNLIYNVSGSGGCARIGG